MSERSGKVQTVLGLVDPSELGHTQTHEHLLVDLWLHNAHQVVQWPASMRGRADEEICIENYSWVRRYGNRAATNNRLLSEADAISEMERYRISGGGTVVEATSIGIARDPLGLARISRATGVRVIMGAGYYVADAHPPEVARMTEGELTERIVRDVEEGADDTGLRSGIIGEIGLSWPVHPDEEKVLRAASKAMKRTGAPLIIHPGRGTEAPLDAMRIVLDAGGDPERTIMSHIDRTLFDLDSMIDLAKTGAYIEFDLFGQEFSYYRLANIDMPNDGQRIEYMIGLMEAGYGDQVVIAQDICHKVHMALYGGEGYNHILENVLPIMRRKGMTGDDLEHILERNPARVLAFV